MDVLENIKMLDDAIYLKEHYGHRETEEAKTIMQLIEFWETNHLNNEPLRTRGTTGAAGL